MKSGKPEIYSYNQFVCSDYSHSKTGIQHDDKDSSSGRDFDQLSSWTASVWTDKGGINFQAGDHRGGVSWTLTFKNVLQAFIFLVPKSSSTSINVVATQPGTASGRVQVSPVMPAAGSSVASLAPSVPQ